MSRRLATIDVGTNTAQLLVADVDASGVHPCLEAQRVVRLGEGVDAARRIRTPALDRLVAVLQDFRRQAAAHGAETVVVTGTSAARDATNRDELVARVRRDAGLYVEILSGDDEARWTFAGALSDVAGNGRTYAVVDVGGGSTEVVVGRPGTVGAAPALTFRRSIDVGSVRLTERHFAEQPPPAEALGAAVREVDRQLDAAALPLRADVPFVGAAGTAVVLGLVAAGTEARETVAPTLPSGQVRAWRDRLLAMSFDEVFALAPSVMEGRADVFPAGVLILEALLARSGAPELVVSRRGLRHGLALRALQSG